MDENTITYLYGAGIDEQDVADLKSSIYLKSIGYDKPSHFYWLDAELPYVKKGLKRVDYGDKRMNHNKYAEFIYSAPTKTEVEKWLKSKETL